jgi:adenylosuccinate lyase
MRRYGLPEPYEQLKALTRGQGMTQERIHAFIRNLGLSPDAEEALLSLQPLNYVGEAASLARWELGQA